VPKFGCGSNHQTDLQLAELVQEGDALTHAAREPVKAMHDELVNLSVTDQCKEAIQRGPFESGAGITIIVESLLDEHPSVRALGLNVQATCIVLNLTGGKLVGCASPIGGCKWRIESACGEATRIHHGALQPPER